MAAQKEKARSAFARNGPLEILGRASLAVFVMRPQAEHQIGASCSSWSGILPIKL
jgi:hypothetical protein